MGLSASRQFSEEISQYIRQGVTLEELLKTPEVVKAPSLRHYATYYSSIRAALESLL